MLTVQEVLKESGFTDEQIAGLDQRAITAFSGVLSTAEREKQANVDFYENQIAPSLVQWDEERTRLENERARVAAEAAFYRTQAEEARKSGFIAADAPSFNQARDTGGRYVANGGGTPGSPTFEPGELIRKAGDGLAAISDIDHRHKQLFDGRPMPILPSELIRQADARHMTPMAFAEATFGFQKREQELQQERQKQHDDKIKQDAVAERDRYWAERTGSNPDVRMSLRSPEMTDISRAVQKGATLPGAPGNRLSDPLLLSENERRLQTRAGIRSELSENA